MTDFPLFLALTLAMGLSIFLSLPVIYSPRAQGRWGVGLNAAAVGILLFLLADVFSNASVLLFPGGYVANGPYAVAFVLAVVTAFLGLMAVDNWPRAAEPTAGSTRAAPPPEGRPYATATMIAVGIGLQNLTEGLVFGVNWQAGTLGVLAVVFVGFFLQNVSEGFPIVAPFLGGGEPRRLPSLAGLFLLGGLPTVIGGVIGYFWSSPIFLVIFDALAIGAIAYVLLPMFKGAFRPLATREASRARDRIVYFGVLVGFVLGFLVNAI
jgi:ZIP family zinc transporter